MLFTGSIVIFLSLIWWVFWYTGNIEVPPEELADDVGLKKNTGVLGLVRTLSGRLSSSFRRTRNSRQQKQSHKMSPNTRANQKRRPDAVPMSQLNSVSAALQGEQRDPTFQRNLHTPPV
ncbi:hypothetical protein GDO81_018048 [Engystomops pustulosus]|uniref:Uncharacterized protein n=1 Tax=Engystomops pustulosus TaxID=76066 RepID=A0AAV7A916_ENGPU|nr:hypothetical protein GDO81_018048 [Engystomops pustulosus]